jgi:hypothetical protein
VGQVLLRNSVRHLCPGIVFDHPCCLRGNDQNHASLIRYVSLEEGIALEHPLREMRALVDQFSLLFLQRRMLEMWWRKFGGSHV